MPTKTFKKLSNDNMSKLVFSNKRIMYKFLTRILNRTLDKDFKIINKKNNKEVTTEDVIEYLMQELQNRNVHVKGKTVDLLIKTKTEIIDLEINNLFNEEVRKRNYAYMCNIYSDYLKHKGKYKNLPKFTQINICKNVFENYYFDNHNIRGEKHNSKFVDNIDFLVFNIARYKKMLYTGNEE